MARKERQKPAELQKTASENAAHPIDAIVFFAVFKKCSVAGSGFCEGHFGEIRVNYGVVEAAPRITVGRFEGEAPGRDLGESWGGRKLGFNGLASSRPAPVNHAFYRNMIFAIH